VAATSVRIGNGCGFWGDNLDAPVLLAEHGRLHYLTLEYLAELTMSILAGQKQRDPQAGFARDFLDVLERLGPVLRAQPGLKIVTNAGGMNPHACAARARAVLDRAGLSGRRVAAVTGDDLLPDLDRLLEAGHEFAHLEQGYLLQAMRESGSIGEVVSANAYLGAAGIVEALRLGADVVITGRVADASLTLGPAVYEFGWGRDDWDRLSAGTVAGHLIECGAQVTGGLWCNWQDAPDLAHVGYPIAEVEENGTFRITKPEGSGGAVNFETVSEQLLYEVGDPAAYLTPDVVADFTSVSLRECGANVVEITGARGRPAPDRYKVSLAYRAGYTASGTLVVFGPDAVRKARLCGEILLQRTAGVAVTHVYVECLGAGEVVPLLFPEPTGLMEVVLRVTARGPDRAAVERFTKEFAPLVTSGPPGVTGYTGGRPPVREVLAYWPALVDKQVTRPVAALVEGTGP
jgi:hypothetical protein